MKTFVIVIVVALVLIWFVYPKLTSQECFEASNEMQMKQPSYGINPMHYEPGLALITSASEFIGMPDEILPAWGTAYGKKESIDDASLIGKGLQYNLCSKSCCAPQYGLQPLADSLVCNSKDKLVGSSYACNNGWEDSGCMCMTEEQSSFLGHRGGNS